MRISLILLLCCACIFPATAQERLIAYNKKSGLTSSEITVTLVDSRGVVWFGTSNGLSAFSGQKWYPVKNIQVEEPGKAVAIGKVKIIFEDSKRRLWVGSSTGLFIYKNNYWSYFETDEDDDFRPARIMEDRQGRIWIASEYLQLINASVQLSLTLTNGMLQLYTGERWIDFNDQIGGTVAVTSGYPTEYFTALFQDCEGDVWAGSLEGAFEFDGKHWKEYKEDELKSEKVQFMMEDMNGEIWVALDNGVARQDKEAWITYKKKDGLPGSRVYRLQHDNKNRIWAFTANNLNFAGLSMFEGGKWHAFTGKDYKMKATVQVLSTYEDGVMAFSQDGVAAYDGKAWYRFGKKDGLDEHRFTAFKKGPYGQFWLAGEHGFYRFGGSKWERLLEQSERWRVSVIFVEAPGRVWVGTERSGAYRHSNGQWKHFTTDSGLADNRVLDIFKDKKGAVWIVSKSGVTQVLKE